MGQLSINQDKQETFKTGSPVFFLAFTKSREHGKLIQRNYFCEGIVVEEPLPNTKAPHKLKILKVAYAFSKEGCSEQDGRTLLNKIIHLHSNQLSTQVPILFNKAKWWI
jgi:hypothetical protein